MRGLKLNENQSENPTEINGSKYYLQIFPCQPRIEYKSKKKKLKWTKSRAQLS